MRALQQLCVRAVHCHSCFHECQPVEISAAAGHPALLCLPCLRITCLPAVCGSACSASSSGATAPPLQIGSSSPLPAASTRLAAAAAASSNCLPEDSLSLHCLRSGVGVGGGWLSASVFTSFLSFSFRLQEMFWPWLGQRCGVAGVHRATAGRWKRREGRVPPSTGHCTASQRSIPLHGTLMTMVVLVMLIVFRVKSTEVVVIVTHTFQLCVKNLRRYSRAKKMVRLS